MFRYFYEYVSLLSTLVDFEGNSIFGELNSITDDVLDNLINPIKTIIYVLIHNLNLNLQVNIPIANQILEHSLHHVHQLLHCESTWEQL